MIPQLFARTRTASPAAMGISRTFPENHPGLPLAPDAGDLVRQAIGERPVYAVGDTLTLPDQFALETGQGADRLRRVSATGGP